MSNINYSHGFLKMVKHLMIGKCVDRVKHFVDSLKDDFA